MGSKNTLKLFSSSEITPIFTDFVKQCLDKDMMPCYGLELNDDEDFDSNDELEYSIPSKDVFDKHKHKFIIFGQATHSGSSYAFYRKDGAKTIDEYPIIVLGDEGGVIVLASNFVNFLKFLTLNVQPYVGYDNRFDLFFEEEEENTAYVKWVEKKYSISKLKSIEEAKKLIIMPAQKEFQKEIDLIFTL